MENYDRIVCRDADRRCFEGALRDFLPEEIFDSHVHVWKRAHACAQRFRQRGEDWAEGVERENPCEALARDYAQLFPGKRVRSLLFGWVGAHIDVEENNRYIGETVRQNPGWQGLAVSIPSWSREETIRQVEGNGLRGLKPYITFVRDDLETRDITIFDMVSRAQWELANERGYVVVLHLPRALRLPDPANLSQLLEIEASYPNVKLIVAHIGRCYSRRDLGDALEHLAGTRNMCFDFSGNTNATVIREALNAFGCERLLFGSDLPLTHIHMRRTYDENGHYINLIDASERPQINSAAYMQPMPDAQNYTFYLYESILAFREAAQALGYGRREVEAVFRGNALRLLGERA